MNRGVSLVFFSYRGLHLYQCGILRNNDLDLVVFIVYCYEGLKIKVKMQSTCQESLLAAKKFDYK